MSEFNLEANEDEHEKSALIDHSIERPMSSSPHLEIADPVVPRGMVDTNSVPCYRFWSFGYSPRTLQRWFRSLPADIGCALRQLISAVQSSHKQRACHIKSVGQICSEKSGSKLHNVSPDTEIFESKFCDEEEFCCYISIKFDPDKQRRKDIVINHRVAMILGIHWEEALARFANFDVDFLMTYEDFLYHLVDSQLTIDHSTTD